MANNDSNEMYNYLLQNYDNVTEENGYYHVTNTSGYKCEGYIPVSYNKGDVIDVYTFTPGQGNSGIDQVKSMTEGNDTPSCAIFISSDYRNETSSHNIVNQAATFASDNGMTIANLGAESFSAGTGKMLESVSGYVTNPNNSNTQVTVVMTEGYTGSVGQGFNWDYQMDKGVYDALSGRENVSIYGVSSTSPNNKHQRNSINNYSRLAENGIDVVYINTDEIGHGEKMTESIDNGMTLYLMGLKSELGNDSPHGKSNYQTYTFVDGKLVRNGEISDYAGVDNKVFITDDLLNEDKYGSIRTYGQDSTSVVTSEKIETPEKYAHLKDLKDLSITIGLTSSVDEGIS